MLNFSTGAPAGVRVEIQDADGKALPGSALDEAVTLYGGSSGHAFEWKGKPDLARLAGQAVRLRFVLEEADVFFFRFR